HLFALVSRPVTNRAVRRSIAWFPEPRRRNPARLAGTRPEPDADAARWICHGSRQRLAQPAQPDAEGGRCYAHSPWRITGTRDPSGLMPSISTLSEPIIQSIWIRLELPPCALICS